MAWHRAAGAAAQSRGAVDGEQIGERPSGGVAVEATGCGDVGAVGRPVIDRPAEVPERPIRITAGSWPRSTRAEATASAKTVAPHTTIFGRTSGGNVCPSSRAASIRPVSAPKRPDRLLQNLRTRYRTSRRC
jgi:hypothetical protein